VDKSWAREEILALRRSTGGICEWIEHETRQRTHGDEVDTPRGTGI
jgi:hypothetical protein